MKFASVVAALFIGAIFLGLFIVFIVEKPVAFLCKLERVYVWGIPVPLITIGMVIGVILTLFAAFLTPIIAK